MSLYPEKDVPIPMGMTIDIQTLRCSTRDWLEHRTRDELMLLIQHLESGYRSQSQQFAKLSELFWAMAIEANDPQQIRDIVQENMDLKYTVQRLRDELRGYLT